MALQFEGNYHLEAVRVISSSSSKRPICECGTRMKSMGKGQGVRCPKCKKRSDQLWSNEERIPPLQGWVQPPADKRRHLAKSLT
jgi:tRNA(Ile2)-agmatinylcytidine synthase